MFIILLFGGLQCHITNPQIPDKHSQINYSVFWGVYLVVVGGNYVFDVWMTVYFARINFFVGIWGYTFCFQYCVEVFAFGMWGVFWYLGHVFVFCYGVFCV